MNFRNVSWLSVNYTALYHRGQNSSQRKFCLVGRLAGHGPVMARGKFRPFGKGLGRPTSSLPLYRPRCLDSRN
jgi:hypothetical protein